MAPITIRAGGYAPPGSTHSRALDHFASTLRSLLGDDVRVELLYNVMDTGRPATDLFDMVHGGELTWCYFSSAYLSHPLADAIEVPFLFDDLDAAHAALDGPFGDMISEGILRDRRFEVLGFWDNGFRHLTNSVRPILTPQDCDGLRIRLQPNETHGAMVRAWGMEPVMVELSEGIRIITEGLVDAQENPLANTAAYGVDHGFITKTKHLYGARGLFADPGVMAQLPADVAGAVRMAARAAIEFQREAAADYEAELERRFLDEGRRVDTPTPSQRQEFRDAAADVIEAALSSIDEDLLVLLDRDDE
jgi:TRAP-type C4-dicarboxylate transport system substrate-binding protein